MKNKPLARRSSTLVSLPALIGSFVGCALAAFFGKLQLAASLLAVFLIPLIARLWAAACTRGIRVRLRADADGVFPGDEVKLRVEITNTGFLPALWAELFGPLPEKLCLAPKSMAAADMWDVPRLAETGANTEKLCLEKLTAVMWYEKKTVDISLSAGRRGIFSSDDWLVRTGDGFGLAVIECRPHAGDMLSVAVYPRLVPVSADIFLKNNWNAETGARGLMQDETVIRSVRDYSPGDSAKHINWRLLSRGLPMSVNVFDEMLPQRVHFIFDGESFNLPGADESELEEALSILASELVLLREKGIPCALSICRGKRTPAADIVSDDLSELLYSLSAYDPIPLVKGGNGEFIRNKTVFTQELSELTEAALGKCWYICKTPPAELSASAGDVTVLPYDAAENRFSLRQLREGGA